MSKTSGKPGTPSKSDNLKPANRPDDAHRVQGEGDYDAARRYDESARGFAQSGQVEPAARAAKPRNAKESVEMTKAEEIGKSHAKGKDPKASS
jgi:hypothetical protein